MGQIRIHGTIDVTVTTDSTGVFQRDDFVRKVLGTNQRYISPYEIMGTGLSTEPLPDPATEPPGTVRRKVSASGDYFHYIKGADGRWLYACMDGTLPLAVSPITATNSEVITP